MFKGPTAPDSINHLTKLHTPILFVQVRLFFLCVCQKPNESESLPHVHNITTLATSVSNFIHSHPVFFSRTVTT